MASSQPLISVLVPAYNAEAYVSRAIESVLAQTYPNFEIVCVDDKSTDATLDLLTEAAQGDSRIRIVRHEENRGNYAARNSALRASRGTYISMLDTDDIMLPEQLETLMVPLADPDVGLSFGSYELYDETGVLQEDHIRDGFDLGYTPREDGAFDLQDAFLSLLQGCFISNSCVLLRKSVAEEAEGWDENIRAGGDRIFYLECARLTKFACVRAVLARKAHRPDRLSAPSTRDAARRLRVAMISMKLCENDREREVAGQVIARSSENLRYSASRDGLRKYMSALTHLRDRGLPAGPRLRELSRAVFVPIAIRCGISV